MSSGGEGSNEMAKTGTSPPRHKPTARSLEQFQDILAKTSEEFDSVKLLMRWSPQLPTTTILGSLLQQWPVIQGHGQNSDKVLLSDILDLRFGIQRQATHAGTSLSIHHWGSLIKFCRKATNTVHDGMKPGGQKTGLALTKMLLGEFKAAVDGEVASQEERRETLALSPKWSASIRLDTQSILGDTQGNDERWVALIVALVTERWRDDADLEYDEIPEYDPFLSPELPFAGPPCMEHQTQPYQLYRPRMEAGKPPLLRFNEDCLVHVAEAVAALDLELKKGLAANSDDPATKIKPGPLQAFSMINKEKRMRKLAKPRKSNVSATYAGAVDQIAQQVWLQEVCHPAVLPTLNHKDLILAVKNFTRIGGIPKMLLGASRIKKIIHPILLDAEAREKIDWNDGRTIREFRGRQQSRQVLDFYKIILSIIFSVSIGVVIFLSRFENSAILGRCAFIHKPTGLDLLAVTVETITMLEVVYSWLNLANLAHLTTLEFAYVSDLLFIEWRMRLLTYGIDADANADNATPTTTAPAPERPSPERRYPRRNRKKLIPRSIINRLEERGNYHPSDNGNGSSDNANAHDNSDLARLTTFEPFYISGLDSLIVKEEEDPSFSTGHVYQLEYTPYFYLDPNVH
ncbi:hypothetical protein SLS58_006102 [Diplodia intermedia]|uniref:Uncharacterized protein n=1 Tax=Diplodia intermedia TaxID=856260 RepID=A0ABR3TP39_9PEZI